MLTEWPKHLGECFCFRKSLRNIYYGTNSAWDNLIFVMSILAQLILNVSNKNDQIRNYFDYNGDFMETE